jgi:hypothetical protein
MERECYPLPQFARRYNYEMITFSPIDSITSTERSWCYIQLDTRSGRLRQCFLYAIKMMWLTTKPSVNLLTLLRTHKLQ